MELASHLFWLIALFLAVLSIVAIKIGFNFDINKYLETRRERQKEQLRILCPHVEVSEANGGLLFTPTTISPPGTHQWICEKCGLVVTSSGVFDRATERYKKNPQLLLRDENLFQKHAKKLYKL